MAILVKGQDRMTVFPGEEKARTMDFNANNVGFVPNMARHYVQNTGDEDLIFLELFVAPEFQEISLNKWLRALPQQGAMAQSPKMPSVEDSTESRFTELMATSFTSFCQQQPIVAPTGTV